MLWHMLTFVLWGALNPEESRLHLDWERLVFSLVESVLFAIIGLGFFALSYLVIQKFTPFSIRKEIEEDQNVALAVVLGAVIIGIAIIVAAPLRG